MDRYNQKWTRILCFWAYTNYAVTLGQTTYYSSDKEYVLARPAWMRHENRHKEQYAKEGVVKFLIKYLWYIVTRGYLRNPYEIDARSVE